MLSNSLSVVYLNDTVVEGQRAAVGLEDAGEEIEVGQQGFSGMEARRGVEACGVVEDFQEDLFIVTTGQEGVGCGVVLSERQNQPGTVKRLLALREASRSLLSSSRKRA
ncbi:MAG: hypothetical protein IH623_07465 [Verrucomicrobia bacterium]|nr:hypothetical protein [Verrucomicrobiota bacterium]